MTHFISVPLSDEYMEELKDQPTQSDENVMAERLNVLSQAAAGLEDNFYLGYMSIHIIIYQSYAVIKLAFFALSYSHMQEKEKASWDSCSIVIA